MTYEDIFITTDFAFIAFKTLKKGALASLVKLQNKCEATAAVLFPGQPD